MSGSYVNITEEEMDEFLSERGFIEISLPKTYEKVYGKLVIEENPMVTLRVYTSIEKRQATPSSRPVGSDAIRLVLVTKLPNGNIKPIGQSQRVYRIATWKNNLQKKMDTWNEFFGPPCPVCNHHTVSKEGRYGVFWGCVQYPKCSGTTKD